MAIPRNNPRKGLRSIRSVTDLVSETKNPQRKFMKLAILAMEKVRRDNDRVRAQDRIDDVDVRLAEIEAETKVLMQMCNASESSKLSETPTPPGKVSPRQARGGFTLKY